MELKELHFQREHGGEELMSENPFNGIESYEHVGGVLVIKHYTGIHSMELKALDTALLSPLQARESIQWN